MASDLQWRWRIVTIVAVFALGTVFGRFVTPLLFRDVVVLVIHGSKGEGCHGALGMAQVRFGWYGGTGDGDYHFECNERFRGSYNLELQCNCED